MSKFPVRSRFGEARPGGESGTPWMQSSRHIAQPGRISMVRLANPLLRQLGLSGLARIAFAAAPAGASTATSSLDVSATVTANCAVSTTALGFGNVDIPSGSNADGTGSLSVTCTNGTAWAAAADVGGGTGATLATRKMTDGTNLLDYALYTDSGRTTVWGDGAGGT